VNFSFHKHSNMLEQLSTLKAHWLAGELPVVDGSTPVIVTFHDVNTYTSNHVEVYLQILLQVAGELNMPTTAVPFYNQRDEIERAALIRTVRDGSVRQKLPGFWNWLWN
jgi:peptidoglycan-N-acetylglucosamine deacetylase